MNLILQAIKALFRKLENNHAADIDSLSSRLDGIEAAANGGASYDAVIQFDGSITKSNGQLISGTYADMKAKIIAHEPLNVLVKLALLDGDKCAINGFVVVSHAETYVDWDDLIELSFIRSDYVYQVKIRKDSTIAVVSSGKIAQMYETA